MFRRRTDRFSPRFNVSWWLSYKVSGHHPHSPPPLIGFSPLSLMRSNIIPFQRKQVAPTIYPLIGLFVHVPPTARTLMASSPPPSPLLARDSSQELTRDSLQEIPQKRLRTVDSAREIVHESLLVRDLAS